MKTFDPKLLPDARRMIESGDFSAAIRLHRKMFPPKNIPMMRETEESDLEGCFSTPLPIFSFCKPEELRELRIRFALGYFSGFNSIFDDDFPWPYEMTPKAVLHNLYMSIESYWNVSSWKKIGVIETVRLLNSNDGPCPVCFEASKKIYRLDDAPSIPILTCHSLNTIGCRCGLVPKKIKGIDW